MNYLLLEAYPSGNKHWGCQLATPLESYYSRYFWKVAHPPKKSDPLATTVLFKRVKYASPKRPQLKVPIEYFEVNSVAGHGDVLSLCFHRAVFCYSAAARGALSSTTEFTRWDKLHLYQRKKQLKILCWAVASVKMKDSDTWEYFDISRSGSSRAPEVSGDEMLSRTLKAK